MTTKTTTQTVRIRGKRVRLVTRNGKVTIKSAPVLEIDLQAAAVRRLKAMPEFVSGADDVRPGMFTLAADQNGSGVRGFNTAAKLKAAGMAAGEPDLRLYIFGGRLASLEFKGERGKLEASQELRFPLLRALGFTVEVVDAKDEDEAADKAEATVRGWLAANDNEAPKESYRAAR
ncbi:nuclease [Mesorhizobium sp. LSHC414A00]|uniref:nuclease n=1 Tax=Mesorhizobium sp. LSHC414A00 TaxID=1287287 RepID=UPI0003CE40F7|nr:nuclease [Mesorhizobium sp. LSHC414A00]ESX78258.1 nuclease [Mesorhizobium sp. LSHC414A00]